MPRYRLHRLSQVFDTNAIFFINACTYERRPLLANAEVHRAFVEFCRTGLGRGAGVGRYVLMPDHVHLFVSFAASHPGLSVWVKSLKNSVSKCLRRQGVESPHWQKGFFDHVLRSAESYAAKWAYVASNPVRKGLVSQVEDWPFQGEIASLGLGR
jgi:putative transposase